MQIPQFETSHSELVNMSHNRTYCTIQQPTMYDYHVTFSIDPHPFPRPKVTAISTIVASIAILILECVCSRCLLWQPMHLIIGAVMIGSLLYRNRAVVGIFNQSLGMAIRIFIFTILGFVALRYHVIHLSSYQRLIQLTS